MLVSIMEPNVCKLVTRIIYYINITDLKPFEDKHHVKRLKLYLVFI